MGAQGCYLYPWILRGKVLPVRTFASYTAQPERRRVTAASAGVGGLDHYIIPASSPDEMPQPVSCQVVRGAGFICDQAATVCFATLFQRARVDCLPSWLIIIGKATVAQITERVAELD